MRDGTGLRRLTFTVDVNETDPAWSPDGSRIALSSSQDPDPRKDGLFIIPAVGGAAQRVVSGSPLRPVHHPSWSPDARRLVFDRFKYSSDLSSLTSAIYVVGTDGLGERRLTNGQAMDTNPSWSPEGREIAFERESKGCPPSVWSVAPSGRSTRNLTNADCKARTLGDVSPSWSFDGRALATLSDHLTRGTLRIVIFRGDGSHPAVLALKPSFYSGLSWQPR
jgi:TolB protein